MHAKGIRGKNFSLFLLLGFGLVCLGTIMVFVKVGVWIDHEDYELFPIFRVPGIMLGAWGFLILLWGVIHSPLSKRDSLLVLLILLLINSGLTITTYLVWPRGYSTLDPSFYFIMSLIYLPCIITDLMGLHFIYSTFRSLNRN